MSFFSPKDEEELSRLFAKFDVDGTSYVCVCMRVYVCMYVYTYVSVCLSVYRERVMRAGECRLVVSHTHTHNTHLLSHTLFSYSYFFMICCLVRYKGDKKLDNIELSQAFEMQGQSKPNLAAIKAMIAEVDDDGGVWCV
jgi:hypothetical protein